MNWLKKHVHLPLQYISFFLGIGMMASFVLVAQRHPRTRFIISYQPGLSQYILTNDPVFNNSRKELEDPLLVHGAELTVDIPLNRSLGLFTGLGFISYGEKLTWEINSLNFPDEIDPYYGFVYQTSEVWPNVEYVFRYTYNYLSIPLLLRWSVVRKRESSIDLRAGLTTNIFLFSRSRITKNYDNGEVERSSNEDPIPARSFVPGTSFGAYYSRDLGKHFRFYLGPQFDMLVMNMTTIDDRIRLPYRVGINLGAGF